MERNNLQTGMRCIKYMLLCVTVMFVLTSALIISVGTTIYALYYDVSLFLDSHFFSPAALLVAIGIIMLFVSLFGCIGAIKESTCLVNIFAVILSLVFILEIAAAVAAYSLRPQVTQMLSRNLRAALPLYYEDVDAANAFDFIQSEMYCCGVESFMDWSDVTSSYMNDDMTATNVTVPLSCCAETIKDTNNNEVCYRVYSNGCLPRIIYIVYQSAGLLGTGAMTIAFVQIIGIVFSFSLAKAIRTAKTERERRRWEITESVISAYTSLNPDNEKKGAPVVYVPFQGQTRA